MAKIKCVLLDFDGTIVDSYKFSMEFTKKYIEKNHLAYEDPDSFFYLINSDVNNPLSKDESKQFWDDYRLSFAKEAPLFEGVKETIQDLKQNDHKLAIVSTSSEERLRFILKHKKLLNMFNAIIGTDSIKHRKPAPDPVLRALELLGALPYETIFVGNAKEDIESGISAGVSTAFFIGENEKYYASLRTWLELHKTTKVISKFSEILHIVDIEN